MNRLPKSSVPAKSFLPGNLLIASPKFTNHPLSGAVILILEHNEQGAKGVVLNSQENEAVKQWCRTLAVQTDKKAVMQQIQAAAQTQQELHGSPFTICMEQPGRSMEEVVDQLGTSVRLLVGLVEWKTHQVEAEIAQGVWMFLPGYHPLLFGDHENLWETCVKCVGESVILSIPGVTPHGDVSLN